MNVISGNHRRPHYKSAHDIILMEENTRLLHRLFCALNPFVVPGTTGIRIQEFCMSWFRQHGLESVLFGYRDFPGEICISINEVAAHGIPDLKPLEAGDLLTVDVAARRKAFHCDAAWTWVVPAVSGAGTSDTKALPNSALVRAAWKVCRAALIAGGKFRKISAIGAAAQAEALNHGLNILPRFAGHGIGRALHEEPVFAFLSARRPDDDLQDGMVINIEPVVCKGIPHVELRDDAWSWSCPPGTLSAQFELSLALLPDGEWRILNLPHEDFLSAQNPPFGA